MYRAFNLLTIHEKRKIVLVQILQIIFGILDLLGVAIVGILGALAINGVKSNAPGNRVEFALEFLKINKLAFQNQVAILGVIATLLFIFRTVLSVIFTKRIMFFLSRNSATLTTNLVAKLLSSSLQSVQARSSIQNLYALTEGVNCLMIGILGNFLNIISDLSLLLVIGIGLFIVNPGIALSTFAIFGIIALVLYSTMHIRAQNLGKENAFYSIQSNQKILEVLNSYREALVRDRTGYYIEEIRKLRLAGAESSSELNFMPNISKYVIETAVILGSLLISAIQFLSQSAVHAVATLAIFMAAGSRIAPALLRVQQGSLNLKGNLGMSVSTLELIDRLDHITVEVKQVKKLDLVHLNFEPTLEVRGVNFKYNSNSQFAIENLNLTIPSGSIIAIVGPSGSGKTTLVDLILGVLEPSSGDIKISSKKPLEAISTWPGAISYVPQEVMVSEATLKENISLGFAREEVIDDQVLKAISLASLDDFSKGLRLGIETKLEERGNNLSGGQRQRIGIARAFYTSPKFLVFDEATSALDEGTEQQISKTIESVKGEATIILIAHRLSTVKIADHVVYLNSGKIECQGTYEYVRENVENFDIQSKL